MPVSVGIITVILYILLGAVLFSVWEEWNLFDGAYYSFITLSTIGFGDIVPGQSLDEGSQEKLIVCALYLLFGMALIAMCFKLMQDDVVQKARWLGQRIGIIVKEELSESESEFDEEIEVIEGRVLVPGGPILPLLSLYYPENSQVTSMLTTLWSICLVGQEHPRMRNN